MRCSEHREIEEKRQRGAASIGREGERVRCSERREKEEKRQRGKYRGVE